MALDLLEWGMLEGQQKMHFLKTEYDT